VKRQIVSHLGPRNYEFLTCNIGLPRTAAWGSKPATGGSSQSSGSATNHLTSSTIARQPRRGTAPRQQRSAPPNEARPPGRAHQDRKSMSNTKTSSQGSSSRPSTPSSSYPKLEPSTDVKSLRLKDNTTSRRTMSPDSLAAAESDLGAGPLDSTPTSPLDASLGAASINLAASSQVLTVPPGLSVPPGILGLSRPPRVDSASPQTPLLASQSTYQMSSAARALLDEVKGRRETLASTVATSPFPDLDRTLETLSGLDGQSGGFSFNLDPKLVGDDISSTEEFTDLRPEANSALHGNFVDAFTTLRLSNQGPSVGPPGQHYPPSPARSIYDPLSMRTSPIERQSTGSSNYVGSFNPFAETNEDSSSWKAPYSPLDDDTGRKMSRFGFARGRHGNTATSSPLHVPSPLSSNDHHLSFLGATEAAPTPWSPVTRQADLTYSHTGSTVGSPLMQQAQAHAQAAYAQHQSRFQPFDDAVGEEPLGVLFHSSQERIGSSAFSAPGMEVLFV
jgi:CCR4-NOT transcription complex subunit 4